MQIATSVIVPVLSTLHTKSDSSWRGIGTRVLASRIPGPVVRGEGLAGNDMVLEGPTSKVGVVLERHDVGGEDDENPGQTTDFFYPPRSCTIPKSGLIPAYFLIG